MKRRTMYANLLVMILVAFLAFFSAACRLSGGGVTGVQATETYGAVQFRLQLTAQAQVKTQGVLP
jgi:hypothetical protein